MNICSDNLKSEINHLKAVFVGQNHYPHQLVNRTISATLSPSPKTVKYEAAPIRISIPYIGKPSHQISRLLKRQVGIDTTFSTSTTLNNLLKANGRNQGNNKHINPKGVVYKVDCDCGESYIGETSRPISTRIKEHKTSTEKSDNKSAISDHILAHPHHKIQWTETTLLARNQTDFTKRKLTEAIHIKRYKPSINRDQGYHIPSAYDHIINQSQ